MKKSFSSSMINSSCTYRGSYINVFINEFSSNDGRTFKQEVVLHPGAVAILPFLDENTVVMIRNERYAVQETLWELPAGTLEINEQPLETAKRELLEETGYRATHMHAMTQLLSTPGFCTEKMHAYVATDLSLEKQSLDESEKISVHPLPIKEVMEMIHKGDIIDAKTIAIFLYYQQFIQKKPMPRIEG